MYNSCPNCGKYSDTEHEIQPMSINTGKWTCGFCHHTQKFSYKPLFVITGASGVGKSSTLPYLMERIDEKVVFEIDTLLHSCVDFSTENNRFKFLNYCLRVAKNISINGFPVILIGSIKPGDFEKCTEARYFPMIHYLALICNPSELEFRYQNRPIWKSIEHKQTEEEAIEMNNMLEASDFPQDVEILDTTDVSIDNAVHEIIHWLGKDRGY